MIVNSPMSQSQIQAKGEKRMMHYDEQVEFIPS